MKLNKSIIHNCQIKIRLLSKLSEDEMNDLKRLTLGVQSGMAMALRYKKSFQKTAIICSYKKSFIGWALIERRAILFPSSQGIVQFNIFVKPKYRKKGIGTLLIANAKIVAQSKWPGLKYIAYPWNSKGVKFYQRTLVNYF